jgi:hypothetical protein
MHTALSNVNLTAPSLHEVINPLTPLGLSQYRIPYFPPSTAMSTLNATNFYLAVEFTNCTEVVYLWKSYYKTDYIVNSTLADEYLLNALQNYIDAKGLAQLNTTELAALRKTPDVVKPCVSHYARVACASEICPLMGWEGNSDIAGLGVSILCFVHTNRN